MTPDDLDSLLSAAARTRPEPAPELLLRVLDDGLALQPAPAMTARRSAPPRTLGRFAAWFGGGPVLAGLVSAALLGVGVGYLNPVSYDYLTGALQDSATEAVDLFPTPDFLTTEG